MGKPLELQTYQVSSPPATHWRPASCAEVGCVNHAEGWVIDCDTATLLGRRQREYLDSDRHGRYATSTLTESGMVRFMFPPGQQCFEEHRVQVRPELYLVRAGGAGKAGDLIRRHTTADGWVEDFNETTSRVAEIRARG